jgi:hypothetical protein
MVGSERSGATYGCSRHAANDGCATTNKPLTHTFQPKFHFHSPTLQIAYRVYTATRRLTPYGNTNASTQILVLEKVLCGLAYESCKAAYAPIPWIVPYAQHNLDFIFKLTSAAGVSAANSQSLTERQTVRRERVAFRPSLTAR